MVTCPACKHEFDPPLKIEVKELTEFEEKLSADAQAAYAVHVVGNDELPTVQYLVGMVEVSFATSMVHDDAEVQDRARQAARMAHVYNRCVQEGWVVKGVLGPATWVHMATLSPATRQLLLVYPKVRADLQGHQGREKLNELLGGYYLFCQEGEIAHREAWDAYAQANGLE